MGTGEVEPARRSAPDPKPEGQPGLLFVLLPVAFIVVLLLATVPHLWSASSALMPTSVGGPFRLVDSEGRVVTEKSWPGKYLLIYFGYTHCPSACPTALADVASALDALGPRASLVQPLFVTLDPGRDTPSLLGRYTALFSPRIEGLSGSPDDIAHVAREYDVTYARVRTGPGPDDYELDHSSVLYLMNPGGGLDAAIRAEETPKLLTADLGKLLH